MAEQTRSIDTPLAEITLRRYERPYDLEKRELVRKLCLSLGILQPGDSRDIIVDILYAMLQARKKQELLGAEDVRRKAEALRKEQGLPLLGVASSNIRRQLKRLREVFIVEKVKTKYRITEFSSLQPLFEEKIEKYLLDSIMTRTKEYMNAVDKAFPNQNT